MGAKLLYRDGQGIEGAVELHGEPVMIGRGIDCAIRTDDAMVSRKHSVISLSDARWWIEDLGSANGTLVNDAKVQKQQLSHDDVVRCGSLSLRFLDDGQHSAPPMGEKPAPRKTAPHGSGVGALPADTGDRTTPWSGPAERLVLLEHDLAQMQSRVQALTAEKQALREDLQGRVKALDSAVEAIQRELRDIARRLED